MRNKYLIIGALAAALMWSGAAGAASGDSFTASSHRHYNEPLWLYDHIIDQTNPNVGHGPGLRGDHGDGEDGFVGGMSGDHGGITGGHAAGSGNHDGHSSGNGGNHR